MLKRIMAAVTALSLAICGISASVVSGLDSIPGASSVGNFIPVVHGTFRAFYQWDTSSGQSRFMVRNARLSAAGRVMPQLRYFLQVDFCDRGKISLLDAYAGYSAASSLELAAGQMRVPFSREAATLPHKYFFANRSFIGKYTGNLRSVGVRASYRPSALPVGIESGIFNSTSRSDHNSWNSQMCFGTKAWYDFKGWTAQLAFMSNVPAQAARINMYDASLCWHSGRWRVEGEGLAARCTGNGPWSRAFNIFAAYSFPLDGSGNRLLTFAARFDGHGAMTDGVRDDNGSFIIVRPRTRRITGGITLARFYGERHFDIRLDYEQYMGSVKSSPDTGNKLTAAVCVYL